MTHIAFVTLLLGLTIGRHPIELTVTGPAHHVEVLLDQKVAGVIGRAPWIVTIDFSEHLVPHRLVARALDESGNELARAEQIVNLPRSPAEVNMVLDRDGTGKPSSVQVLWQSVEADKPKELTLSLDGKNLALDPDLRAKVRDVDTAVPHLLRVHGISPTGVVAESEIAFGGGLETSSGRQLTAIPVRLLDHRAPASPAEVEQWLTIAGNPAHVVAVEELPGDVVVVRHPASIEATIRLDPRHYLGHMPVRVDESRNAAVRHPKPQVHFVWPSPMRQRTRTPTDLMPVTYPFEFSSADDFKTVLTHVGFSAETPQVRYADAVSVAGIRAMDSRRPRAVVLLLGEASQDESEMTPVQVREYLRSIGVPLFVWTLSALQSKDWGETIDVVPASGFSAAFTKLRETLQSQRIVWIDGNYFPYEASVTAAGAKAIEVLASR